MNIGQNNINIPDNKSNIPKSKSLNDLSIQDNIKSKPITIPLSKSKLISKSMDNIKSMYDMYFTEDDIKQDLETREVTEINKNQNHRFIITDLDDIDDIDDFDNNKIESYDPHIYLKNIYNDIQTLTPSNTPVNSTNNLDKILQKDLYSYYYDLYYEKTKLITDVKITNYDNNFFCAYCKSCEFTEYGD